MYSVRFRKSAIKELERLPSFAIKKIRTAIDHLSSTPRPPGCQKMSGSEENI